MKSAININFDLLRDFLALRPGVICCYCFGSAQDGTVQPGSDLDLAILINKDLCDNLDFYQLYSQICDLYPDLECVDAVNLNNADPILAIEALSGRMIIKNDRDKTAAFASLMSREYEDVMANIKYQYSLRSNG